ncbi:hypothetical protein [Salinibaculum salinum]|uniref:hypothetical protein n=1 Tax=Salinibaculum salinum TaxID=3131996 RepID=UPI0030EC3C07
MKLFTVSLRYALSEIRKHGLDRTWWRRRFLTHVVSRYYEFIGHEGTPVTADDWDNLLVLDACRYDLFTEAFNDSDLPGILEKRRSVDSATPGFLEGTFGEGTYHDTVYVTANPYVRLLLDDDTFHAVVDVWEDDWDDEYNTVFPDVLAERALSAAERYSDKRLIIHFIQPHYPFVGDVQIGEPSDFTIRDHALGNDDAVAESLTPFERLERGELDHNAVWEAYLSNLKLAFPAVRRLMYNLRGKTVVTADHGNALGERASPFPIRVYGHPLGIKIPALTDVPWLKHQNGDRKPITAEPPTAECRDVDTETQERLRSLGYTE